MEDNLPEVGYVYYFGEMSSEDRCESIRSLNEESQVKVFVSPSYVDEARDSQPR